MCENKCKNNSIDEIIDKEMISVLKFMLQENKKQKKLLVITIWFLIFCLFAVVIFNDCNFKNFMSQYDYATEAGIETTANESTNTTNNGSINIGK